MEDIKRMTSNELLDKYTDNCWILGADYLKHNGMYSEVKLAEETKLIREELTERLYDK